jgi:hypothetical protein
MLRALLADMRIRSMRGGEIELGCLPQARGAAEKRLDDLARLLASIAGAPVTLRLTPDERGGSDAPPAEPEAAPPAGDPDHPLVKRALEVFNGRIIDIKPLRKPPS